MKTNVLLFTFFFLVVIAGFLISEPGFNGTSPGCSGSGCHTLQSGIVSATVLSNNQVRITVTGNSGTVAGELVNSNGTVVAVINSTSTNPFILTAPSGGSYTINAGYKSPSRVYGTTTVNIASAPTAPTSLNTNSISAVQINLSWTDNSSDEDGFKIERKTGTGGTFSEIAQVNSNVTSYNNTGLQGGTQYCYRVRAFNTAGNSGYTNESCAATFPDTPSAPSNLVSSVIQNPFSVMLGWTDNSSNESGFIIEKEIVTDTFLAIDTVSANVTAYQDMNVAITTYRYRVKAFNASGSSSYSNVTEIFVPVELTSFTAESEGGKIYLRWQTATETNNKGFEVERRLSGSAWSTTGFISGKGTTTEPTDYVFTDAPTAPGKYIYRLKQIDYSGAFEYSKEVEAEFVVPQEWNLSQNYPNPFNPATSIEFTIPMESNVSIKIYNTIGSEIAQLVNERKAAGVYKINFDAAGLPSGMYFYKISANGFEQTRKMLLMK